MGDDWDAAMRRAMRERAASDARKAAARRTTSAGRRPPPVGKAWCHVCGEWVELPHAPHTTKGRG